MVARESGEEETIGIMLEKDGRFRMRKGAAKEEPALADSEALRARYELLQNVWLYAELRHPAGMCRETYRDIVGHLLGPKVLQLRIKDEAGREVSPSFFQVLHYERAVRKKAYELVREGDEADIVYTLHDALRIAIKDAETRALYQSSR